MGRELPPAPTPQVVPGIIPETEDRIYVRHA